MLPEQSNSAVVWDTPQGPRVHMAVGKLHQLLWEAAGVGSGAVMAEAPDVVMPTDDINEGLERLLDGHGLPDRDDALQSDSRTAYERRVQLVLDAMPRNRDVTCAWLAELLGGTVHEICAKLMELRRRGLVTYEPGYRTWCRS